MKPLKKRFNASKFLKISLILFLGTFLTIFSIKVVQAAVVLITAEKTVLLLDDMDKNGIASPGDILEYTVTIFNKGDTNATGVVFNDTLDINTTLVADSLIHSPIAVPDVYPEIILGNVRIDSSRIPFSVLTNDNLGKPVVTVISLDSPTSTNGGNVTMVTSGVNMGQFTYDPPPGFEGTDSFTYTLTNSVGSSTGKVSLTVSKMIWFINNNTATCTTLAEGCGRLSKPFSSMASFAAINNGTGNNPAANDLIFVYESSTNYSGAISLLSGQKLIGQDSSESLANLASVVPASSSDSLPSMNTASPFTTLGNTVTLNSNTTVRGLKINTTNNTGMNDPSSGIGNISISEVSVTSNGGTGINFSAISGTFNFDNITVTNGPNGIVLDNFSGSFTLPAGSITNTSSDGIRLISANNVILSNITITDAAKFSTNPACNFTSISSICEASVEIIGSNQISLNNLVINQNNLGMQGIVAQNSSNLTIKNSQILNVGNADNESGMLLNNLYGNVLLEDLTITNAKEFGIRLYQTSGNLSATLRRVKIENNNGIYGEDGLSIRVEGGTTTILVDDSDFLNTGGSGVAASVQGGGAKLNLSLLNSTWSENYQLPHAVSFVTSGAGVGNITIQNNSMTGCATPGNCFGAIDLDASDTSSLNATISGNTLTNTGDGTGIEFIVNDGAIGKAAISNNSLTMQPDRIGMNFMARSAINPGSNGRLDLTLTGNTINGISSNPENVYPGMNFQSGSSSGTHAQTLCVNAGGNIINGSNTYAYMLRQRTGTTFQLQGMAVPGTNELNVENFVKNNNSGGTLTGNTDVYPSSGTTIVNYTAGTCLTPLLTPTPAADVNELEISDSTNSKSDQQDELLELEDFNNPPENQSDLNDSLTFMSINDFSTKQSHEVSLGILPPGSSVIIKYKASVNNPLSPINASQVVNQGTVSGSNFGNVLTDDPTIVGISDPTVMLLPKPDLTAIKTNNVSGMLTLPNSWNWKIRLENKGNFQAEFTSGDTLLTDQLPVTGLTYSNVTVLPVDMSSKVDCSIQSNTLNCVAQTDLTMEEADYFEVSFDVTPTIAGLYTNPISSGICTADPDGLLIELDFVNNSCSNSVAVNTAPIITSADSVDFLYNSYNSFPVLTSPGYPTNTIVSVSGTLPAGINAYYLADGSATISGTPTATGSFNLTITASNSAGLEDIQSFTLHVNRPPGFTSSSSATFTTGTPGVFSITTVGYPLPAITYTSEPALPASVTLVDNADGTASLSGTPAAGDGGVYTLTLSAKNGIGLDASQTLTLTIGQQPAITSTNNTIFVVGTPGTFTFTSSGYPAPVFSYTGSLPSGISFTDNLDGTARLSGTPTAGTGGQYPLVLTAANGVLPDASQNYMLTIQEAPAFTSDSSASFTTGVAGTFTITTIGYPTASITFSSNPALPASLTLTDNGDGTANLSGTPVAGDGGAYAISLTGSNGVNPEATQTLTLSIGDGPAITSSNKATFVASTPGSFAFTSSGYPSPTFSFTGTLPGGISFTDNLNGTASLSGTPTAGSGGLYPLVLIATNGLLPDATQNFTLTVNEAPTFTSGASASFTTGILGSFPIATSGYPTSAITYSSNPALPVSLIVSDNGDGTATLSGTPATGDGGVYVLTLTGSNGVSPNATQTLILTIGQGPAITSVNNSTFVVGTPGSFTITASGYPDSSFSISGSLPSGVIFTDNLDGTANLSGTPADGMGGLYPLTITADNGIPPYAEQSFTLTVNEAPEFNNVDHANFNVNEVGEFTITTDGYPLATISFTSVPNLPVSITLMDNADGTATLSGTPQAGDGGIYSINLSADNGVKPEATQSLTLTIGESPVITTGNQVTFVEGNSGSFTIITSGTPVAKITFTGELPDNVSLVDQGDGTAILSGTPVIGTANTYPINIIGSNMIGDDATQTFTLIIQSAAGVLAVNSIEDSGDGVLVENEHTNVGITQILVAFNHPMDTKSVMDPSNYTLEKDGSSINIDAILYDVVEQTASLKINGGLALPDGKYKLTVNGNILDELGYPMGDDFMRNFIVDTVFIEIIPFGFTLEDGTILKDGIKLTRAIQNIEITFNEDAANPVGDNSPDDVTNPNNYLLVQSGPNGKFDTITCKTGVTSDDILFPVGPIVYDNKEGDGPFKSRITLNKGKALPNGLYRLFVCGSTSISDLAGNKLNNGIDHFLTFTIQVLSAVESLPATGFAPGRITVLHSQPLDKTYHSLGDLWLEFPTQNIKAPITGVPWVSQEWDLTWLNKQVGWLEGTAFPTWNGNTVLTAHAFTPDGLAGPFAYLKYLKYGDSIIVHYNGLAYHYAVRSQSIVTASNTSLLSKSEKLDWLTLITCQQFDETSGSYLYRRIVRAVLIKVVND